MVKGVKHSSLVLPPFYPLFQCKCHRWSGVRTTVDGQIRTGDVRGLRTGDERHQRGDLINMPIAVERCGGLLRHRIMRSISSSVVSSNVFGMAVPALFTSTSSPPNAATVFSTAPLMA